MLFLDDDARLDDDFVSHAMPHVREDVLVTGFEWQESLAVRPNDLDFLGFMRRPPGPERRSLCMNATIFPTAFLRRMGFDEFFRYGYEEADIALAALRSGMTIVGIEAANWHDHAAEARDGNRRNVIRSRAYLGSQAVPRVRAQCTARPVIPHARIAERRRTWPPNGRHSRRAPGRDKLRGRVGRRNPKATPAACPPRGTTGPFRSPWAWLSRPGDGPRSFAHAWRGSFSLIPHQIRSWLSAGARIRRPRRSYRR